MPLQHASAPVLKRMKRGASGDIFLKLIERIRRTIPGVAIRTSFIAGFPGETEADFETLCQFVEAAQFDRLGVFSYSDEDTSGSYALDGKVDGRTIAQSQAPPDGDPAQNFAREKSHDDRPRSCPCWWKARRPIPTCSGRRACRRRRPKSTASC